MSGQSSIQAEVMQVYWSIYEIVPSGSFNALSCIKLYSRFTLQSSTITHPQTRRAEALRMVRFCSSLCRTGVVALHMLLQSLSCASHSLH